MGDRRTVNRRWKSIDDLWKDAFDPNASALTVIDENHRLIHDGFYYNVWHEDTALANGGNLDIHIDVPAGAFPHVQELFFSTDGGPITIELFEDPTITADGTPLTVINRNRVSDNVPEVLMYHTPTVGATGTSLGRRRVPLSKQESLFSQTNGGEFVLAPSTKYLIRLNNASGQTRQVDIALGFYELQDS